jgi:germination protein M
VKIKRSDVERMLIAGAAGLVLLLAIRGGEPNLPLEDAYEEPFDQIPVENVAAKPIGPTQPTVVYYQDGEGYLVPVQRQVGKQEGIAKATLGLMVKDVYNDMEAARLGLRTVIPEGTTFDLNIAGGRARIDVSKEALATADAEQEANMVSAVVYTLTEFPTVTEVEFLVDGQKRSKLTHGTDVSGVFYRESLNLESVDGAWSAAAMAGASQVQLYFPSENGRLLVPVTRMVYSEPDINTAMLELAKGPRQDSGLQQPLPEDVGLVDVKVSGGVATVSFTREFMRIAEQSDGGLQAVRALMLTCTQYPGVTNVRILVDGKEYTPQAPQEQTTFANVADLIVDSFPEIAFE